MLYASLLAISVIGLFSILQFSSSVNSATLKKRASTRCISGQACFPSNEVLNSFNKSIGGRLSAQRPFQAACYATDPLFNLEKCVQYTTNFLNPTFLISNPNTYDDPVWETCGFKNSCQGTAGSLPLVGKCNQGNVPIYSVAAKSTDDIIKFMTFARQYNLRISVKGTGHDYKGRSSGKNSVNLWTYQMNEMQFNPTFKAINCPSAPSHPVVILGPGTTWGAVYEFAHKYGYMVVGGDANSVGAAGGWPQGGGHSYLTPLYGLGVDNIVQVTMVLANGTIITANQCNHPDIFWATRGAGGGNLGILTEMVMKAHKEVPLATISFTGTGLSLTQSSQTALIAAFAKAAPELGNQGFAGQVAIVNGLLSITGIMPNKTAEEAKKAFAPIQNLSLGLDPKSLSIFAGSFQFGTSPTWYDYGVKNFGGNQKEGIGLILASWLIPSESFENPEKLANQLHDAASKGSIAGAIGFLQVGGNQTGARGQGENHNDPSTTSVTPAWNSAIWLLIFGQVAISNNPDKSLQTDISYVAAHNSRKALTQLIPNSGAYQNEADIFQDDPRQAFWGIENYNRLLSIKQQIDPQNLFSVWQGIGWVENGGRDFESDAPDGGPYSCYPSLT